MNEKTELAWAAGFIEGEGHIEIMRSLRKTGGTHWGLHILVANVYRKPLARLQEIFGGTVYIKKGGYSLRHALQFAWGLCGQNAMQCLIAIEPYLCFKRKQANIGIEFQKTMRTKNMGGYANLSDAVVERREALYQKLRALTHVGPNIQKEVVS